MRQLGTTMAMVATMIVVPCCTRQKEVAETLDARMSTGSKRVEDDISLVAGMYGCEVWKSGTKLWEKHLEWQISEAVLSPDSTIVAVYGNRGSSRGDRPEVMNLHLLIVDAAGNDLLDESFMQWTTPDSDELTPEVAGVAFVSNPKVVCFRANAVPDEFTEAGLTQVRSGPCVEYLWKFSVEHQRWEKPVSVSFDWRRGTFGMPRGAVGVRGTDLIAYDLIMFAHKPSGELGDLYQVGGICSAQGEPIWVGQELCSIEGPPGEALRQRGEIVSEVDRGFAILRIASGDWAQFKVREIGARRWEVEEGSD